MPEEQPVRGVPVRRPSDRPQYVGRLLRLSTPKNLPARKPHPPHPYRFSMRNPFHGILHSPPRSPVPSAHPAGYGIQRIRLVPPCRSPRHSTRLLSALSRCNSPAQLFRFQEFHLLSLRISCGEPQHPHTECYIQCLFHSLTSNTVPAPYALNSGAYTPFNFTAPRA